MKNNDWSKIAGFLVLAGALNWGLIGFLGFNLVSTLTGPLARFVYMAVGVAAVSKIFEAKSD
jgi:uncharacterized membrane protein YuzA (DUF378 family)